MVRYLMMQLFSATCQTVYLSGDGEELNLLQEESYARQMLDLTVLSMRRGIRWSGSVWRLRS